METGYRARIWGQYRHMELTPIEILDILDEELVKLLTDRINNTLRIAYKI